MRIISLSLVPLMHPVPSECLYDLEIRIKGRRHFRPGHPGSTKRDDFWTELQFIFVYTNGNPTNGCPNETVTTDWMGCFGGIFIMGSDPSMDFQPYNDNFQAPADPANFISEFMSGAPGTNCR